VQLGYRRNAPDLVSFPRLLNAHHLTCADAGEAKNWHSDAYTGNVDRTADLLPKFHGEPSSGTLPHATNRIHSTPPKPDIEENSCEPRKYRDRYRLGASVLQRFDEYQALL
jgi:hypothetical protein